MKKLFSILALLCLSAALLCACSKKSAGGSDLLPGVWVNAGQYSEGRDFVETLTVNADGTLRVHLDYQGAAYADLDGTWVESGKTLTFTMSDGTVRVYDYAVSQTELTLEGSGKTVAYQRK